jgi:hypothetical protein
MGYNTAYALTWEKQKGYKPSPNCEHDPKSGKFCPECGAAVGVTSLDSEIGDYIAKHDDMSYAMTLGGSTQEQCKWYEHDKDMIEMSMKFPLVLFKLHGEGEESGDIWDAYYLNGKSQKHKARVMIAWK